MSRSGNISCQNLEGRGVIENEILRNISHLFVAAVVATRGWETSRVGRALPSPGSGSERCRERCSGLIEMLEVIKN